MNIRLLSVCALIAAFIVPLQARPDDAVKAVYHLNQGNDNATAALRNIRNHLEADPKAVIQVVTHGPGIDFLLQGTKDKNGGAFANAVEELSLRGVVFKVCRNTLQTRDIPESRVLPDAKVVPSGIAEIARLQAREGYVYVKP